MTIWFAADIPESSQGGVARNMLGFCHELRGFGHDVSIVFAPRSALFKNYLAFMLFLAARFAAVPADRRPAAIIARSTDGLCCALLARLFGMKTRVILHNHGWEERGYAISTEHRAGNEPPLFTWRSPLIRFPLLRLTLALCHGCLCGTIDEIRWLRRRFPTHAGKFLFAPNGVEPIAGTVDRRSYAPHFLCVGAAGWRKNLGHTLSVFASVNQQMPNTRLFVVGAGPDGIDAVAPRGLNRSAIEITASASMEQMTHYFSRCPFLLTTSWYEGGHALVVLEAMAHGCVVFARAIPSITEIIRDRHNGVLLSCIDPVADADAVITVLNDRNGLERMSLHARRTAERNRWARQGLRMNRMLLRLTGMTGGLN